MVVSLEHKKLKLHGSKPSKCRLNYDLNVELIQGFSLWGSISNLHLRFCFQTLQSLFISNPHAILTSFDLRDESLNYLFCCNMAHGKICSARDPRNWAKFSLRVNSHQSPRLHIYVCWCSSSSQRKMTPRNNYSRRRRTRAAGYCSLTGNTDENLKTRARIHN
jgi:hypothetical protein